MAVLTHDPDGNPSHTPAVQCGDDVPEVHTGRGKAGRKLLGNALTICGATLVAFFLAARVYMIVGANVALAQTSEARPASSPAMPADSAEPDMSLWSVDRISAFRESLGLKFDPPLAVLRIPRCDLEVPVLRGANDASLNRGLGWIEGTTLPGKSGNVAIAGHRDGFFRILKDLSEGDVIELVTDDVAVEYVVASTEIIDPGNVSVLAATDHPVLTLVTCYPFYYVGPAPQRFIVKAEPKTPFNGAAHSENGPQLQDKRSTPGGS